MKWPRANRKRYRDPARRCALATSRRSTKPAQGGADVVVLERKLERKARFTNSLLSHYAPAGIVALQ